MSRPKIHFLPLPLLTMLLSSLLIGGGFQLNEHGARAMAQGGAFVARANDPSAIYFNPAGLAFIGGAHLYGGVTLIAPQVSFFGPSQLNVNTESKMISQTFTPINVYGTYQIVDGLTFGIGVNNPFGLGTEWNSDWIGKYITTKVDLSTFFVTPTVGYRISDNLSVGVGVNYVTGKVTLDRDVAIPFNSPPPVVSLSLKATSYGFNVGVLYKLSPVVSVGASYRSQVKLDATGTATFSPNYTQLSLPGGDITSSLTLPATGFVGVSYKAMDNLELEADYQYVGWSSFKELSVTFKADNSVSTDPENYQDTYIIRVGGQYTIGSIQLRAGYLYDHTPIQTAYLYPMLPDANRNGINLGVGYELTDNLSVDISYMFLKFDQRVASNTVDAFDGTYNASANLLGVDLGYSF